MPKRPGRHPQKELTAAEVRSAKPGRHTDGNGLYLEVDPSGARWWMLRVTIHGKRRDIGLGSATMVSLAEARQAALDMRSVARSGGDPLTERRRVQVAVPTFENAARTCHEEHKGGWKSEKHAAQWLTTLEKHAFPIIGSVKVDQIGTPEVRNCLLPVWLDTPETARRVRQRIGTVLDWAATKGFRQGENPVRSVAKGLPKHKDQPEHFAALSYKDVPTFLANLRETGHATQMVKLLFEFLVLTATRSGEARGAQWDEFDLRANVWLIPSARTKTGKPHAVPLAPRVLALLKEVADLRSSKPSAYVFPGERAGKPMSDMTLSMLLRRMQVSATPHGFRTSFRMWCAEATNFPWEVAEASLSHVVKDKAAAAYMRSDFLEKRRNLMELWAQHCDSRGTATSAPTTQD